MDFSTPFENIYHMFLTKITDDMYMELTRGDTEKMLQQLLLSSIHKFQFPRVNLYDYDYQLGQFNNGLTNEQINILATYMIVQWLGQQLASVENTRMKYSGSDFKFTSQANHMQKLLQLKKDYQRESFHLQRLYKRRYVDEDGYMRSTMGALVVPITHRKKRMPRENQV